MRRICKLPETNGDSQEGRYGCSKSFHMNGSDLYRKTVLSNTDGIRCGVHGDSPWCPICTEFEPVSSHGSCCDPIQARTNLFVNVLSPDPERHVGPRTGARGPLMFIASGGHLRHTRSVSQSAVPIHTGLQEKWLQRLALLEATLLVEDLGVDSELLGLEP